MTQFKFNWFHVENGIELTLSVINKGWFGREKLSELSKDSWPSADQLHAVSALARLEAALEEGEGVTVLPTRNGYRIDHQTIAALTESQATALGLPYDIPYELRIDITGPLADAKTIINLGWYSRVGKNVRGDEIGVTFDDGSKSYRIPEPLFTLIQRVDDFNAWDGVDLDERLARLSALRLVIDQCVPNAVDLDEQLKDLRLLHASSTSLDISVANQVIDFDPVLFSKEEAQSASESGETLKESNQLLPPVLQPEFAKQFRQKNSVRRTYILGRNKYVFIDPSLRDALQCIKSAQNDTPEARARFAKSPQSFIKQYLLDQGVDDELADKQILNAFVETDRFSERVLEVGLWSPPVLPYITREPNTWLPQGFGVKVGSESFVIPEDSVKEVAEKLSDALVKGDDSVEIPGTSTRIPANTKVLDAVNCLLQEFLKIPPVKCPEEVTTTDDGADNKNYKDSGSKTKPMRSVLLVQSNFDSESFIAQFEPRKDYIAYDTPNGLLNPPKGHQVEGMSWLQQCWSLGYPGVLLADDMGLGKTYQTLGFLSWLFEVRSSLKLRTLPALILAPTSLLGNWEREARFHLAESQIGKIELLYGKHLQSLKLSKSLGNDVTTGSKCLDIERLKQSQWILTTYETMRDYHISLASIPFNCIIFDEMQKIKSPTSMMTNAAQSLNGDFKIGLTGTPIENSLSDIWTIFDTLMPGVMGLGDLKHFMGHYNIDNPDALRELKKRLTVGTSSRPAPMLRRMKSEVAKDLPEKRETIIDLRMPDAQADAYSEAVKLGKEGETGKEKMEAFQRLRNVSLHPYYPDSNEAGEAADYISMSARLKTMIETLDGIYNRGEKALIFIESKAMHEWLAFYLKERYTLADRPARIFGSVSATERSAIVEKFQNPLNTGFDVLLLSPKAAGVGLTLTAATHVIHLSRWWNPAVEDQCTDRAYRIGQTKDVTVYIPRAIHPLYGDASFDCVLHELLDRKRSLSKEMLIPLESSNDFAEILKRTSGI